MGLFGNRGKIRLKQDEVDPNNPHATSVADAEEFTEVDIDEVNIPSRRFEWTQENTNRAWDEKDLEAIRVMGLGYNFRAVKLKKRWGKDIGECEYCSMRVQVREDGLWWHMDSNGEMFNRCWKKEKDNRDGGRPSIYDTI